MQSYYYMGLQAGKPVFRVYDKVLPKPTETS